MPSGWSAAIEVLCNYQRMYPASMLTTSISVNVTCQPNVACKIYYKLYHLSAVYSKPFTTLKFSFKVQYLKFLTSVQFALLKCRMTLHFQTPICISVCATSAKQSVSDPPPTRKAIPCPLSFCLRIIWREKNVWFSYYIMQLNRET